MTFASKFNAGNQFEIDFQTLNYVNLKDLHKEPENASGFRFTAVWFNRNGAYGEQAVLVLNEQGKQTRMVSLPAHLTDTVKEIVNEYRNDILLGKCGFTVYSYTTPRRNKECYSVRWVDLPELELPF